MLVAAGAFAVGMLVDPRIITGSSSAGSPSGERKLAARLLGCRIAWVRQDSFSDMPSSLVLRDNILPAWRTTNRVTVFLIEHLPPELWAGVVPGAPRRTVRMIAGHIHNARCMWIKTLGRAHGIDVPEPVDRHRVGPRQLVPALNRSSRAMVSLLQLGCDHGGSIPPSRSYTWRNLPLDVGHVLAYFVAHEGHHRGQIVMLARQLGCRLPAEVTGGLWQWSQRAKEGRDGVNSRGGIAS